MTIPFANGARAQAMCDVCGFQYRLSQLRNLVVNTLVTEIKACCECWVPDQPQLQLGRYPVNDPIAIRDPRIDTTYYSAGTNTNGYPSDGSRVIYWGWYPVGGGQGKGEITPNPLIAYGETNSVTVTTS